MSGAVFPSLVDRHVIVTGGASGIGAEIVAEFTRQGSKVGFVDLDADGGEALAADLADARHKPFFRRLDLTDLAALETTMAELVAVLGGADVLVNNAANDERHALSEVTPDYWRDRMAVNLDHQVFMAKAVLPAMEAAGKGSIINMGSCSWRLGLDGMTAYVTAKAAIEGLTNGLARELAPHNIRVNCVIPGFIKTQRQVDRWLTPELERTIMDGQCLQDFIDPVDVARMVAFLASDDARMCTSGTYNVDAGWI
ncbi:MAG: SDR family oxidoreductase [Alphaproteobacteria bacterium]|nr:SDR family oxidoreductase [Alphaproteobacteria bacterium]